MFQKIFFCITFFTFSTIPAFSSDSLSYEIEFNDGVVKPQELKIPAGKKVKLIVKNIGKTAEEFESNELNREKIVAPGKSVTIFLGPLKKGSYKFFGEFHEKMETSKGQIIAE